MNNELVNSLIEDTKSFIENELSKYNYSSDIKHLLTIIIPAFIIKYELKNKNKILTVFKEVPIIETDENDKTTQAFYTSIPRYIDKKIKTKKLIVVKHYKNKPLIEFIDNIIHEYNHAINSFENEIKVTKNFIYLRTGLTSTKFDKHTLKPIGSNNKNILEEILNTKQSEEVINILKEMSNYEIKDYSVQTTLYSINHSIDKSYSSEAYSLHTTFLKKLSDNRTFTNTLSNLRFNGNINEISYIFDNTTGKTGSYERLIDILNEVTKLENEYPKTIFKKLKLSKIKSLYNEINRLIDNFNNNYHYK